MHGLDLFSGIGGLTKALEGYVQPIAYCEIDKYVVGVLLSRMATGDLPVAPIWNDVATLSGNMLPGRIDIIYGGFPCQDISVAGRNSGLGGKRSGLFFEIVRIVGEIRPTFIFLENVPAIRTRGADIVIGELDRLGYDCRFDLVSASEVGSQIGEGWRWFVLAKAKRKGRDASPLHAYSISESKRVPRKQGSSIRVVCESDVCGRIWCFPDTCIDRSIDALPVWMERLKALGNAVVPAQAREAFERLMGLKENP